jgi:hypothetical protein
MESVRNTEEMSTKARLLALAFGFFLVAGTADAGPPVPGRVDSDGDTIQNAFDNCTTVANPTQTDTDHNGCGDACTDVITCDVTGDLVVGAADLLAIGMNFGMPAGPDCNGDTVTGTPDVLIAGMEVGNSVGPSGITTAQCDPVSCICTPAP